MEMALPPAQQTDQRSLHVPVGGPKENTRWSPRTYYIIEACGAKRVIHPPVVFKGTAHYKGWYTEVTGEKHAYRYFACGPRGYTTGKIGLDWLQKFDAQTKLAEVAEYRLVWCRRS